MAIRDRDIAAEIIGIRLLKYKVLAFVVAAFYAGVAGALVVFCWYGSANIEEFDLVNSVRILGMVIIGGMGSVVGSFLGAGFVTLLPILVSVGVHKAGALAAGGAANGLVSSLEDLIFGTMIVLFLVLEPLGLARLWKTIKDYLRLWPFAY
jgi:branched-chain amino acid transport system permease protein